MLTYQVRPRIFRLEPEQPLVFPSQAELRFHFRPAQPFGVEAGGGRTAVKAVAATASFNANTGETTIESKQPLAPLEVSIEAPNVTARLDGNALTVSGIFESLNSVAQTIESIFFMLPALLNVPFADPPYIERVDGTIGSTDFRWELARWRGEFRTTTQQSQEQRFAEAWARMSLVAEPGLRRLAAALHYFHIACRLNRAECTAGEFVAEAVLNYAKTLEVLFPPEGQGGTRDAARRGLRSLGLMDDKIEADFIPAMALRNEIDVGHVELGLFKPEHLTVIHAYIERAENAFREMLEILLTQVESNEFKVAHHELGPPSDRALQVVERLKERMSGLQS